MEELNGCGGGLNKLAPVSPYIFECLDTGEWNSLMGLEGLGGVWPYWKKCIIGSGL